MKVSKQRKVPGFVLCHRSCLCAAVSAGNCRQKLLCVKMASVIETEFRIRTLQAPLGERRNKDRLGHIFCNLRLIIVPGGTYKGRGEIRHSPLPLLSLPRSLPTERRCLAGAPPGTAAPGLGAGRCGLPPAAARGCLLKPGRRRTAPCVPGKLDA